MLRFSPRLVTVAVVTLAAFCSVVIWAVLGNADKTITPATRFSLTEAQLTENIANAEKGDLTSIWRISDYYGFYKNDMEKKFFWVRRAADLGDDKARYLLASKLYFDADYSSDKKMDE